ncbi:MAG: MurR/RpiR family transcriptional regulator [Rhizobiaceae bacterium]|nr:MurR/RpiR family transcriptional regulator [Rhizobiaceae bacterium]
MAEVQAERISFDVRVETALERLAPAEARMARFFSDQKQAVLLGSAAQIAEAAGASDATVVRTARALGYEGLSSLREDLVAELTGAHSPSRLLKRTLDEIGDGASQVLDHVVALQEGALSALRRADFAEHFGRALDLLAAADCRHVFGIGPSGALADYACLQFNRIGLRSLAITQSGVGLADRLLLMRPGDAVVMMAYAPLYREVSAVLERAEAQRIPVVLISDSLGPFVGGQVAEILSVPRGRADHLALHGGTMVLIEALVLGLAARDRDRSIDSLDDLSTMRGSIDKNWLKRGTRKPKA